jgi:SAM-dependent methyltransferase
MYATDSTVGDMFTLCKCIKCNCFFLSPSPTIQQICDAYNDSYYGLNENKFSDCTEKILDFFRFQRARTVMRHIKTPANVLDIGCGNGQFLQMLIKYNYKCYGIEMSPVSVNRSLRIPGINLKLGELCEDDFEESFFDVVTMWHVFEHLHNPKKILTIIQKIIKRGGYVMVSLPNIDSFQSRLFKGKWLHLDPPRHLFYFGSSDLINIMKTFGFEIESTNYFSLEHNPFGIQQSILNCILKKREILFEALKGNLSYSYEYSCSSIALQKIFHIMTFPFFALLSVIEASFRIGGTMELIFRKNK